MKILVDGLSKDIGGIGTLLMNIAKYNAMHPENDIEFYFLVPEDSEYIPKLQENSYKYYVIPSLINFKKYKKTIQSVFKENSFDYVWINNSSKVNLFILKYSVNIAHAKVITHTHGVDMEEQGLKRFIFKTIEKLNEKQFYKYISIPFACSEEAADSFYKNSKLRSQNRIIKNGIFTSKYMYSEEMRNKIHNQYGFEKEDIILGAVGRLSAVKNYKFLIRLLAECPDTYKLLLLGDGPEKEELLHLIDENGLKERAYLAGNVNNVYDYLCAMDFFMMPSLHEGMPFSIVEAQACGLQCLVSDTVSEEVDLTQKVSFLKLNDVTSWKNELEKLQNNRPDRLKMNQQVADKGYSIENGYHILLEEIHKIERGE